MATTKPTTQQLPDDLLEAMEHGVLSQEQLRQLIEFEAGLIGLDLDEAIRRAYDGTLPNDPIGSDLRLLISILVA